MGSSEDPEITAWNISCTSHTLGVFLQLLALLPGTRRPSTPAPAWRGSSSQLVWVIPFMLDTPQPFLVITAHVCNQTCSDPYPVLHDIIPYQLLLISFFLSLIASFRHIQILRLLHQMRCGPLPPDTDWGKLGTKSPLCIR